MGSTGPKVNILGIGINKITLNEALQKIENYLEEDRLHLIVTANPEIIMLAKRDEKFAEILKQADLITADGIGLVIGAKILGEALPERVTGIDLSTGLFNLARQKDWTLYFLGGAPGIAAEAAANLMRNYPGLKIIGWHHGYFQDSEPILQEIEEKEPDILLVALGMGKQEKWIIDHQKRLPVKIAIGVGGSLDVHAGRVQRAPEVFQKLGLEWFYRLLKQPSRIIRMMVLPVFLMRVLKVATTRSRNAR